MENTNLGIELRLLCKFVGESTTQVGEGKGGKKYRQLT